MSYKPFSDDVLFLGRVAIRRGAVNGYVLTSDANGNATWQAGGGGGATWGSITGTLSSQTDLQSALDLKQNESIVINSNTTAVLDGVYTVVASATFTDPTPAEGKGFMVFVRNGTATVGGTAYSIAGTIINRIYHSGAWANYTSGSTALIIGTTPITSGTVGRVLFEGTGNVLQENAILNLDTTNGLIIGGATARGTRLTVVNSSDTSTVQNIVVRNAADSTDRLIVYGDGNIKSLPSATNFNASNELQFHIENTDALAFNVGISFKGPNSHTFITNNQSDQSVNIGQVVSGVPERVLSFKYASSFSGAQFRCKSGVGFGSTGITILNTDPNRQWGVLVGNTSNAILGTGGLGLFDVTSGTFGLTLNGSTLNVGVGSILATARLHIRAGSATANTAPLKFTSGTLLSTAEAGAVEFLTDKAYLTITTGAARKELTLNDAALTSGVTPVATTNGRLTDGLTLAQGTYTPTLTGVTNVSSTTAFTCQFMRVGSVVTVSGKISVTPTTNNTQTILGVSLPIASNFAAEENCGGLAHTLNNTAADQHGASIYADATNDRATFNYYETHGSADLFTFTFTYRII